MATVASLHELCSEGLFHCTTIECFKGIRKDHAIRPNLDDRAFQHGISPTSCCFRLHAISLFDPAVDPERNWLRRWLNMHRPITIAIKIDPTRLDPRQLFCRDQARKAAPGAFIARGEVCYRGEIPLEYALGFLLVWGDDRGIWSSVEGNSLTDEQITAFEAHARSQPKQRAM